MEDRGRGGRIFGDGLGLDWGRESLVRGVFAETGEDALQDGQEVGGALRADHPVPHGLELLPADRVGDVAGRVAQGGLSWSVTSSSSSR